YTGNDLAIDMVFYGSDYLLGLSAFAVEAFAARDRLWMQCDGRAIAVNDLLQYLGQVAFRAPVPAYKHSAAQFLHLRGRIATDRRGRRTRRQSLLHLAHGRLGRNARRRADRSDAAPLASFRNQRREADVGRGSRRRPARWPRQSESAVSHAAHRSRDRRLARR